MTEVLAGDVGGTTTRLAIVAIDRAGARVMREHRYASADYPGLAPIVKEFLAGAGAGLEAACFAVAGPVRDNAVRVSNLPWVVTAKELAEASGIARTALINDFSAIGYGLSQLGADDLVTLQEGEADAHGVIGVIGAGTGLGEGFLVWDGARHRVQASEGGHTTFAARNEEEWRLAAWLAREFGHVSFERIVSGPGLAAVYRFLASQGGEDAGTRDALAAADDPAPVIAERGVSGQDPRCARALDMFVSLYGAQAGNLALTLLATGGVYVAGGIAAKIIDKLRDGAFLRAFCDKGRMREVLSRVPVRVVISPEVGLLGAAAVAVGGDGGTTP